MHVTSRYFGWTFDAYIAQQIQRLTTASLLREVSYWRCD